MYFLALQAIEEPFISGDTFRKLADVFDKKKGFFIQIWKNGDIVF
ncbi:hypothetical protein CM15mP35_05760 [bacterium]|nr:MAG: hypothetical protein CM15mP35_05760 [bacterium]